MKAADIALVALDIARGVQNKVLEAMAMALPVVVTPQAATGIAASDGREFLVRSSDEAIAEAITMLASDAETAARIGRSARRFVLDAMSWQAALAGLPELLGSSGRLNSHAA
ncbi:MAG: glycosyltransferase [Novosphingobium sp.]|nr:glycosyltransferase [Novosphingobium sp.]